MRGLSKDATLLITGQALRAAGYGFTAVVLGAMLASRGYGPVRVGVLLFALVAGTAGTSLLVGAVADRVGRRRCYAIFFTAVAFAGALVAVGAPFWLLLTLALTGTLSTDVVDNGPATTLEQVMLAAEDAGTARVYGYYNAVGAAAGALGALGAAGAGVAADGAAAGNLAMLFGVLLPVGLGGAVVATRISPAVDITATTTSPLRSEVGPSRRHVRRLSLLFAIDAAGGGLVTTAFLGYWFSERYGVTLGALGWLFFSTTVIQAGSAVVAPRLARRFGLVATMVGTHLPSNILLALVAFAPTFPIAAAVLLARTTLSQMDVPARQALVMTVVTPAERTAAAAVTNAARYSVRPLGPLAAAALQQIAVGAPLIVAGLIKAGYDLGLWRWARRLRRRDLAETNRPARAARQSDRVKWERS